MTNRERQRSLDKKKWLESEKQGYDMAGLMDYCDFCDCADDVRWDYCAYSDEQMVADCKCAKAYNRMVRCK